MMLSCSIDVIICNLGMAHELGLCPLFVQSSFI